MDVILIFLVSGAVCGAIASAVALAKGASRTLGFFLGAFLGPIGILIAALLGGEQGRERQAISAGSKKKCPECAELVQSEAKVCRFCRHSFAADETLSTIEPINSEPALTASSAYHGQQAPQKSYGVWAVGTIVLMVALTVVAALALRSGTDAASSVRDELSADAVADNMEAQAASLEAMPAVNASDIVSPEHPAPSPKRSAQTDFDIPALPTALERTQCHMGECVWDQITSVSNVDQNDTEFLRKVITRQTTTTTPEGEDYPEALPSGDHEWSTQTSYYLCSISRPTAIFRNTEAKDWIVTKLTVVSPFGYMISSVANYKRVCHGIKPGSALDQHPDRLGYVDREDVDQTHTRQPANVLR